MKLNNICCLGGDLLGRVMCISIAYNCPEIRVIILDKEINISEQKADSFSCFGPEFVQILKKCRHRNLFFSSLYESAIKEADLIFLSVNIPIRKLKEMRQMMLDYKELEEATNLVALYSESDKIIVEKTDVPIKAVEKISNIVKSHCRTKFQCHVLSVPAYINERSTIDEIMVPERVVIGCHSSPAAKAAAQLLREVYELWIPPRNILTLSHWSAGLYKVTSYSILAQKQFSVNSITAICEETGADVGKIMTVLSMNSTTGPKFLVPSAELDGFHEDPSNLVFMCEMLNLNKCVEYWEILLDMNGYFVKRWFERMKTVLGAVSGQEITVWGFTTTNSSKKTNSPIPLICEWLVEEKSNLKIYDPDLQPNQILKDLRLENVDENERNIQFYNDKYLSIHDSLGLLICLKKKEFVDIDFTKLVKWMKRPLLMDTLRLFDIELLNNYGIKYFTLGTQIEKPNASSDSD